MGLAGAKDIELRFAGYVEGLVSVIGHADRARPLWDYCVGLVLPCERKSVEPMAAVTAPERVNLPALLRRLSRIWRVFMRSAVIVPTSSLQCTVRTLLFC